MKRSFIESRIRKWVQGTPFLSLAKNIFHKYGSKTLDTATKIGINAAKTVSKKYCIF